MAAEKIGDGVCPLCRSASARVSLSKSGLAVMTCNACNAQIFTRSGRSDEIVRGFIRAAPPAAPDVAVKPTTAGAAPAPVAIKTVAPAPAVPAPAAAKKVVGLMPTWFT